ncbi:hypothetical protein, partial [Streptomyces alkaliphilus]|uniref:hypothetical protein n=1 Tax=Streptomyces alkaliphilus TaxID=1472722 RepID=UPI0038999047
MPRKVGGVGGGALRVVGGVAFGAFVDRDVAAGGVGVGVVTGGEAEVAGGVEDDVAADVATDAPVGLDVEDGLLGGEVEGVPDEFEAGETGDTGEAFPVLVGAHVGRGALVDTGGGGV